MKTLEELLALLPEEIENAGDEKDPFLLWIGRRTVEETFWFVSYICYLRWDDLLVCKAENLEDAIIEALEIIEEIRVGKRPARSPEKVFIRSVGEL